MSKLNKFNFENTEVFAKKLDAGDALKNCREQFLYPKTQSGEDYIYFAGNSLGLQPKNVKKYIDEELEDWAKFGVEGHFHARHPWMPYHEFLTEQMARVVGAKPIETVVMNTLTVNLHLMMVSFYQPTKERFKILVEGGAFPSDQYAVETQAKFHGYNPSEAIIELKPRAGEYILRTGDILKVIEEQGSQIALILLGSVNYFTGQAFDISAITKLGHQKGCRVGFDLAHGAGNLKLQLHDWGCDFAVWCSYKYLNGGPGTLAGCFVHERHANNKTIPRFAGWWGHNKSNRFKMESGFDPIPGAEGWQISNPPIFQMAALRASLEIFDSQGMTRIREKGDQITAYAEFLLRVHPGVKIITPEKISERGSQLSLKFPGDSKKLLAEFNRQGVIADFREPDVIRISPAPLYCRYRDVYKFSQIVKEFIR
jgi:kynureninase